jgi:hypothetical protein
MAGRKTDDVTAAKLDNLIKTVDELKAIVMSQYVTRDSFEPVRMLVFGQVAVILIAVIGAIVALVITGK